MTPSPGDHPAHPLPAIARLIERLVPVIVGAFGGWRRYLAAGVLGVTLGAALLLFQISNAKSYLSDAPEACINCHVMTPYYASWFHSSHRSQATCNDCHVPHDGLLRQAAFKAMDGLRHATAFTLRREPQALRLNPTAVPVVQRNCVRCHEHQIMRTNMGRAANQRLCWECHRETPHGRTQSLSSTPHVRRPTLPSAGLPRTVRRPTGVPGTKRSSP